MQDEHITEALKDFEFKYTHIPSDVPGGCWRDLQFKFSVVILYKGRELLTTPYRMGSGHMPQEFTDWLKRENLHPTCLIADAAARPFFRDGAGMCGFTKVQVQPKDADVLHCLLMDGDAIDYDFDDWCANYGYDTDSRKAYDTYQQCLQTGLKLRNTLGEAKLSELREAFQDF